MARQLRSITVRDLRNLLEGEDDDALVIFEADYGDYYHTRQALPLDGEVEEVEVKKCPGYSNSGFSIKDEDEDWDELTKEEQNEILAEREKTPKYLLLK